MIFLTHVCRYTFIKPPNTKKNSIGMYMSKALDIQSVLSSTGTGKVKQKVLILDNKIHILIYLLGWKIKRIFIMVDTIKP
jgi:hypothetical protein